MKLDNSTKNQTPQDAVGCPQITREKPDSGLARNACELSTVKPVTNLDKKEDITWRTGCLKFKEDRVKVTIKGPGAWGTINSLLTSSNEKTKHSSDSSANQVSYKVRHFVLYTGSMRARNITTQSLNK